MSQLGLLPRAKLTPRYYQLEAIDSAERMFADGLNRVLLVMATGLGKSVCFGEFARRRLEEGASVMVLAHRTELVEQNQRTLETVTGETCYIEQGKSSIPRHARVVSASVQSVTGRLYKFETDRFDYVIPDEFHHYVSPTYKRVLDHFNCRILGVTATPDRADEKALGRIVDDVAYEMDILDGVHAGYLVPVKGRNVDLQEVDLSQVKITGGDFAKGELDRAVLKGIEGMVQKTLELDEGRFGILFFPGVLSAETACLRLNALRPGCAEFVHGGTPEHERRNIFTRFRNKEFQFLCNCLVATEGFDAPHVSLIGFGRPTTSRALATQMAGRGTRVLPGLVDHLPGKHQAARRRLVIAASKKSNMLLLNFVGNRGRHSLIGPEDILGGKYDDDEIQAAKRISKAKEGGGENSDPLAALKEAREQLRRAVALPPGRVKATVSDFDPFDLLGVDLGEDSVSSRYGIRKPTERQLEVLANRGVDEDVLKTLDRRQAHKLLDSIFERKAQGLASLKQLKQLSRYGITDKRVTKEGASAAMDYLKSRGWGKASIDQEELNKRLGRL